jgi:hypothetical protein
MMLNVNDIGHRRPLPLPWAAMLILACGLFVGCFRYSFSGAVPSHLKTIAVPLLQNQTAEFGIAERITDQVISEFQRDNTLKIADPDNADSILRGSLVRIEDEPYTYSGAGEGQAQNFSVGEYRLTLTVRLEYFDQTKSEVVWQKDFSNWGTYDHSTGSPEEREQGFDEAIQKLAEDILNQTVSGW